VEKESVMLEKVLGWLQARQDDSVKELKELLSIPSVSTKPEHAGDVRRCAQWVADYCTAMKLSARIYDTPGHPVVVAKNEHRSGRPTVLVYGHYDVQPPEPLDEWVSPPFEPTVRDGAIYARGAADDKGQTFAHLAAIRAWQEQGGLPVNITLMIEGEEEIGSLNLESFIRAHRDELKADIAVVSDTNQFARGVPAITYGLRGLVYMEVKVTGPAYDLHSGLFGGTVANPANVLAELLATLHTPDGRVNIPGFYDDVLPLSDEERAMWKTLPFDEKQYAAELNVPELFGEAGYSTLERKWARPTCDINGLTAGYQGKGAKTVIGATASAKVSMRLVPHQDPAKIAKAFEKALRDRCPKSVTLDVHTHSYAPAVLVPTEGSAIAAAKRALEKGFGKPTTLIREGGSIPVVGTIKSALGIDTLLIGFALSEDRVHSPNEKFDLDSLHNGTRTAAALYQELASA
jgi:acetylornithine deacetylase/succinyl-diaminopimelate desuccinylase-like protein